MELTTAMILAAGYGTRLHPKTLEVPKALVESNGQPMIRNVIEKLRDSGIKHIVVNTHHFAGQLEKYFAENNFGVNIYLSFEREILGTGGGIKNARKYLEDSENFLVHNVDVESGIDISKMVEFHVDKKPLVTLAVKDRNTTRPLLIDEKQNIIGRRINGEEFIYAKSSGKISFTAFCGVHLISAGIFELFPKDDEFDIVAFYMDLIEKGHALAGYNIQNADWKDLGKL